MSERGRCSYCQEYIGLYVPKGGDGSLLLVRPHNEAVGVRCPGAKREPKEAR